MLIEWRALEPTEVVVQAHTETFEVNKEEVPLETEVVHQNTTEVIVTNTQTQEDSEY